MASTAVITCLHDDHWFVEHSLRSFDGAGPKFAFVSRLAWNGTPGAWEKCAEAASRAGAEVIIGDWPDESMHRSHAIAEAARLGFGHVFIPDGDEIVDNRLLEQLLRLASIDAGDFFRVRMRTYWRSPRYSIRPPEQLSPILMLDCHTSRHLHIREYSGSRPMVVGDEHGVLHHLSYCGPDERVARKIETWGHRSEVDSRWFQVVWKGWSANPLMADFHPTHGPCFHLAAPGEIPAALSDVPLFHEREDPPVPSAWSKPSIVIPLYGGEDDIRHCLQSLRPCLDLLHEVIVVDDASPDDAACVAEGFEFVRLLRHTSNLGFSAACNRGLQASDPASEVVLFLNSDTLPTRAGLIRLIESLTAEATIGAAGPYSNYAGYHQPVLPTYEDISGLETFARDFSWRRAEDEEVPLLVGFCLAVKRRALEEAGAFDTRFGGGLFEDNDLSYRLQRLRWRLVVSGRSYVHHEGSRSLDRVEWDVQEKLSSNMQLYEMKWREDIECGFASHLPGQDPKAVVFHPTRNPDRLRRMLAAKAALADICLTMIVRNEERVLADCLSSVKGLFAQVVIVDTGSTDRTVEIAESFGAEVYRRKWPNSFSVARNEALKYVKTKWVFWLDADDTLPVSTAESILDAAITADERVAGFVVPIQFTDQGPGGGTRVDHVKLFRNLPGVKFEYRIHEQVLPSLTEHGAVTRIPNALILHSGYDTSEEGQNRKRERDWKLLKLDLKERPGDPFVLFNCGMTALFTGQASKAIKWLSECLELAEPRESIVRKAYSLLAAAHWAVDRPESAIETATKGLQVVGEDPEMLYLAGLYSMRMGRYKEAKEFYLRAPEVDVTGAYTSYDVALTGYRLYHNLGGVCMALGQYEEALTWWRKALECSPRAWETACEMFAAAMRYYDFPTAKEAAQQYLNVKGADKVYREMISAIPPDAAIAPLEPASSDPEMASVRKLLQSGREQEALPALRNLSAHGSAEAAFYLGVEANRRRDYPTALVHFSRALELSPHHAQTADEVRRLKLHLSRQGGHNSTRPDRPRSTGSEHA